MRGPFLVNDLLLYFGKLNSKPSHGVRPCVANRAESTSLPSATYIYHNHAEWESLIQFRAEYIQIFTADALFTQRPLAKVILESGRDFLFAVKDNQPDLLEALRTSFLDAESRPPDVETTDKKGEEFIAADSGLSRAKKSNTSAMLSRLTASS
jgi:hypothetical protein